MKLKPYAITEHKFKCRLNIKLFNFNLQWEFGGDDGEDDLIIPVY